MSERSPIRAVVAGVSGRMGSLIVRTIGTTADFVVTGGVDKPGSASIGLDVGLVAHAGPTQLATVDSLDKAIGQCDVVIDFTAPEVSSTHARQCAARGIPIVIGSTGFSAEQNGLLQEASKHVALIVAPNMSVGVNLMISVAVEMARRLGLSFDVEISETHHRHKKDAPSGTALRLASEIARARGRDHNDVRCSRVGHVGDRPTHEIGVQSHRGGDVVGDHSVFFLGDGERIELTHRASNRDQFAHGALRAARWIIGRPPGLYGMTDVLSDGGAGS